MLSKKIIRLAAIQAAIIISPQFLMAQSGTNSVSPIAVLIIIGALLLVAAIVSVSENLLQIEGKKYNIDSSKNVSLFPRISDMFGKKSPAFTNGEGTFILDKGYDINLAGKPAKEVYIKPVNTFAVRPTNFRGIAPIPKLMVSEKDEVLAGDVLFYDKSNPDIKYVSPVSGEVAEIRRGAKRAVTEIVILADKKQKHKEFKAPSLDAGRDTLIKFLLESGAWTLINERPYDVVPSPSKIPENIFVSTFDTAPLAPDASLVIDGNEKAFQMGVDLLGKLTSGSVHLGLDANGDDAPASAFTDVANAETHWFAGKHPSGNVGVQIHHIAPIKSGTSVWTVGIQEVITLGNLILTGKYDATRVIAVGGSQSETAAHYKTYMGANIGDLIGGVEEDGNRIISGDVLSGRQVTKADFLDNRAEQISIIPEGDFYEMFGWLLPIEPRPTISKTFPNFLYPTLEFDGNTNTHGEKRAFVVTGEYEKVLPMNIFPQHLMKAILANDFEQMEGLGIYELSEEDVALCEFVCTSKMPLQSILRQGLDTMREQG